MNVKSINFSVKHQKNGPYQGFISKQNVCANCSRYVIYKTTQMAVWNFKDQIKMYLWSLIFHPKRTADMPRTCLSNMYTILGHRNLRRCYTFGFGPDCVCTLWRWGVFVCPVRVSTRKIVAVLIWDHLLQIRLPGAFPDHTPCPGQIPGVHQSPRSSLTPRVHTPHLHSAHILLAKPQSILLSYALD